MEPEKCPYCGAAQTTGGYTCMGVHPVAPETRRAVPAPEQSDRERANNLTSEWYRTAALLPGDEPLDWLNEHIASLLAQVRAEERERCARVAESLYDKTYWDDPASGIAAAIRKGEP